MKKIEIVPYNKKWPQIYAKEAKLIENALDINFVTVHHIGSTSVPGLAAKPKIDIIAVVKNGDLSISQLENNCFTYKGEWNIPFKFGFTKRTPNKINLHVLEENHPEIELNILFRDYLCANLEDRNKYEKIKQELLLDKASFEKQNDSMFLGYTLGKDKFIRHILQTIGYSQLRFLFVTHIIEWTEYHRIKKEVIFDPFGVQYDPQHHCISSNSSYHFILCKGTQVVTVAHIQLLNEDNAVLSFLATDSKFQRQGYGKKMMFLLEKWLKKQKIKVFIVKSGIGLEAFYRKLGFIKFFLDESAEYYLNQEKTVNLAKII